MKNIYEVIDDIKNIKLEDNPSKLIKYLIAIDGEYFPSTIMLDKARAIQLSEENEYNLDDAKNIIEMILQVEPDYIPAYIEMGCFYDTVMDDPKRAIDIFNKGISIAQHLIEELFLSKAEALVSIGKHEEAAILNQSLKRKNSLKKL